MAAMSVTKLMNIDYPLDEVVQQTRAIIKPNNAVLCTRCPNVEWIEETTQGEYGGDNILRASCAVFGEWIWPTREVVKCSARTKAIKAEMPKQPSQG